MALPQIQANNAAPMVQQPRTATGAPNQVLDQVVDQGQGGPEGNIRPVLASNELGAGWQNVANGANDQPAPVGAGKLLSELTDEELGKLGGDLNSLRTLADAQPNLTVGEVMPLIRTDALDGVADIIGTRSDLQVSDFVSRDQEGKIRIDPSVYDENSRGLLKDRDDIKPSELSAMRSNFARQLRNPAAAKQANDSAMDLLRERRDIKPQDAAELMGKMVNAVGGTGGEGGQMAAASAVDMFKNAGELLKQRHDLDTGDMGRLADAMGNLGGKKDPNAASQVATGFGAATKALGDRPDMPVDEMISLADTMKNRFPGDDADSSAQRMQAFTQGAQMVVDNPGLGARGVDDMLARAAEGNPPKKGDKLLNAFQTMGEKLNSGEATIHALTDRNTPMDMRGPRRDGDVRLDRHGNDAEATGEAPREDQRPRDPRQPEGDQREAGRPGGEQRRPGEANPGGGAPPAGVNPGAIA